MSLRHGLLAILSHEPKSGYEIANGIDGSLGFFWASTHQQIYKELAALLDDGFVRFKEIEQDGKPAKKVYTATVAGDCELKHWLDQTTEPQPAKDAFLIKLFVGHLCSESALLIEVQRHIEIHKAKLKKYKSICQKYFRDPDKLPARGQFQYLTLRRGLVYEQAWLKWAAEVVAFLELRSKKIVKQRKTSSRSRSSAVVGGLSGR